MKALQPLDFNLQRVASDVPNNISELFNLRHDGEDVTALFSELGSKELFEIGGKCYGAIVHADKCYAILKNGVGEASLVCYQQDNGEVVERSRTSMEYVSEDLAQMFIVRNELIYLDGREYKSVELPQYTLNGETTTSSQKEDVVGADGIDVSVGVGGGFVHPVRYFIRRKLSNGAVTQLTGQSMTYVPTNGDLPLKEGEVSSHGWKLIINPYIDGTILIYRVYADSTSLVATLDVKRGQEVTYDDEAPNLGQAIADEGVTDSPLAGISGSAIGFWSDRSFVATLSGENGEATVKTNIDVSMFPVEERAIITWKIASSLNSIKLNDRFRFGTFINQETYCFVARVYFANRVEIIDLGSSKCNILTHSYCTISLNPELASYLLSNGAYRVDYGYAAYGNISHVGIMHPSTIIKGVNHNNRRYQAIDWELLQEYRLFENSTDTHILMPAFGDNSFNINGERELLCYTLSRGNYDIDRTFNGNEAIKLNTDKEVNDEFDWAGDWNPKETPEITIVNSLYNMYLPEKLRYHMLFDSCRVVTVDFSNKNAKDDEFLSYEKMCMLLPALLRKYGIIKSINGHRIGVVATYGNPFPRPYTLNCRVRNVGNGETALSNGINFINDKSDITIVEDNERARVMDNSGEYHYLDSVASMGNIYPYNDKKYGDYKLMIKFSCKINSTNGIERFDWYSYLKNDKLAGWDIDWIDSNTHFWPSYPSRLKKTSESVFITLKGHPCCVCEGDLGNVVKLAFVKDSGFKRNSFSINSPIYSLTDEASIYCEDFYYYNHTYVFTQGGEGENILYYKIKSLSPSRVPSMYRSDNNAEHNDIISETQAFINPMYYKRIEDQVFLDIESKSFVDKTINDIKVYWSLPLTNKSYKPWQSFYPESFKTLDRLGEVLKMFPVGNALVCVCTDGIQALFAPQHALMGEDGESIALTNASFNPTVRTITKQPLTENPDNIIQANDFIYILSEKQGELIIVSPNLEVKAVAAELGCKLLVDSIASSGRFRSSDYSYLSFHYDKNELLLCDNERSVSYNKYGFEITSLYNDGISIFVSGKQCYASDDGNMYELRVDNTCRSIVGKKEDVAIAFTLVSPAADSIIIDGIIADTSYVSHTLFDESVAKNRKYRLIGGRNDKHQNNPWNDIEVANSYSSVNLALSEKGIGRHVLYAACRFLENTLRITIPRVNEIAGNSMRLHGNKIHFKLKSSPKARILLKGLRLLIHGFNR